jgi:hypothetical protein
MWLEPPRAGFPGQCERAFERGLDRRSRDQALGTLGDARNRKLCVDLLRPRLALLRQH